MIVVDTNVVAYFFIDGDRTEAARRLWEQEPAWALPPLWRHEFLNVLATYCRAGGMDAGDVLALWHQADAIMAPCEQAVDLAAALSLAIETGISAYDAQFVCLAHSLETRLITEDKQLLRLFAGSTTPL
ncbi:MAG: type II toxin-antitoxin system VapC family toxin [Gammaproteobacteria bacterium]|nr:type II toxin-antitoxin system VapC family toxin [Gammaproteobacteria bacterium]